MTMFRKQTARLVWAARRASTPSRAAVRPLSTTTAQLNIISSTLPDIELPSGNLASFVLKDSQKWAEKTAVECAATGRAYTYSQLVDRVSRLGGMLTKLGIKKGDVVALLMFNCPEYPIVVLGAANIGAGVTLVNSTYTPEEIHQQLKDSDAKLLISEIFLEKNVEAALTLYKKPMHVVMNGPSSIHGAYDLHQILEDRTIPFADPVEVSNKDLALMPYSSGTTGRPKGVIVSHSAVTSSLAVYSQPEYFIKRETTGSYQDTFLCYLPFFHMYGAVIVAMMGLYNGIKLSTVLKMDPNTFTELIRRNNVRILHTVPTVLNFLIHSPTATSETLASVDNIICGAAPVAPSAAVAFKEKLRKEIFFQEGYGMTECIISHATHVGHERIGSCGRVLSNVSAKVIDVTTGEMLPANQNGEICLKTPMMMTGYFQNTEATEEAIDKDGWLHTGDVGKYDEEGYFTIVDRIKELIKVKSLQVAPSELEDLILQHPKVLEVGVVGVPDERMGEVPRAYVVTSVPVEEAEIKEFLEPQVAPHKKLAGGVVFIKHMPKSATGKLLRRELKKMALQ